MADHKHGEMDIQDHEKTFEGFMSMTQTAVIVIFAVLILMAIFIS